MSTTTTTELVIVPNWIKDVLDQEQKGLKTLLDPSDLLKTLSTEDQLDFFLTQGVPILPFEAGDQWTHPDPVHRFVGNDPRANGLTAELRRRMNDTVILKSLVERLALTNPQCEAQYELVDLKNGVVCLVLHSKFTQMTETDKYQLVQNILKLFYIYEPPYKVVQTPLFRTYLALMKRTRQHDL